MVEVEQTSANCLPLAAFWSGFLGFAAERPAPGQALLRCGPQQCALRLVELPKEEALERGTA